MAPRLVKEGVADIQPVEDALGTQVAVGQDCRRSMTADDPGPTVADRCDGLSSHCFHALELSGPFTPGALQGMEHSVRAVDPLFVVVDFYA